MTPAEFAAKWRDVETSEHAHAALDRAILAVYDRPSDLPTADALNASLTSPLPRPGMTDHDAHDAACLIVDWAASARRLLQAPPSPSKTLLGLAALRVALDTSLRLASLDPAVKAEHPPLVRDPDLGSHLQRARNGILPIAEKIGQEEQLQRPP